MLLVFLQSVFVLSTSVRVLGQTVAETQVYDNDKAIYIGCYTDDGPSNRLLKGHQKNFQGTLTPEICNKLCFEKGFSFAGTEYSIECFCSKNKPSEVFKTPDFECNVKCAGDDTRHCGGNNRLSVFTTGLKVEETTEPMSTTYIGCFVDNGSGSRLLQGFQQNFPKTLTPELCNALCFEKGFPFAGTEYSVECFCSSKRPPNDKIANEADCNAKCVGNEMKKCGGSNRLSVYSTGIREPPDVDMDEELKYIGCFRDYSNGSRILSGYHQDFPDSLTNQMCIEVCRRKGFVYAGTQYGIQCFCDNRRPSYMSFAKEEECYKRCIGNVVQTCGGDWKISLFETGIIDSAPNNYDAGKYHGCFKDGETRFLNGHAEVFVNILTPPRCTGLCYSMGYLYAGVQNGKECYCGDQHTNPNLKVPEEECSKPCSGNPSKMCGGSYRNSIYETGIPDYPIDHKYIGCFNDQGNHILNKVKIAFEKTNTPRRCMNYCKHLGFKFSGVEYGKECLCGNDSPRSEFVVSGDECKEVCSGDSLETCGAGWRLAVYSTDVNTNVNPVTGNPNDRVMGTTAKPCVHTDTTVGGKRACKSDVIFEDEFNSPLGNKWRHVVKIADAPDFEFTVLHADPKNSFVSQNQLVIKPTLFSDMDVQNGTLSLPGCTGRFGSRECGLQAFSYLILPPVASARINTGHSFSFRYGIVEVRAKLPVGDWLVPELWLEPSNQRYGQHYASGRIRIAMTRGNQQLRCGGKELGLTNVESGVLMGPEQNVRNHSVSSVVTENWHENFHTYTLTWRPDSISIKIDDGKLEYIVPPRTSLCDVTGFTNQECINWGLTSNIAPFDGEFYLSVGLTSGNSRDFPDDCVNNGHLKPWKNFKVKAMLDFWMDKPNWISTWSIEKSALYVDYIRVTAL